MNDPYKILNVSPDASDEEVKKAYRTLARKYHPDNYADNPLADLAQEKMKEVNEAYELIQKQRRSSASSSYTGGYGAAQTSYTKRSSSPLLQQVRAALDRGDVAAAESLLSLPQEHTAEWHFLMGKVSQRRGWMDEALRYYAAACRMEPGDGEYRAALEYMQSGGAGGFRPQGYSVFTTGTDDCTRICMCLACTNLLGGGWCFCPIYY